MSTSIKRLKQVLAGAALAGAFAATAAAQTEIRVGHITSLSGPVSTIGVPYSKGMKAGNAFIGEIGGFKVRVIELDDASDPSAATRNARKLIEEDKVDLIVGTAGSPLSMAVAAVTLEQKVPQIAISPIALPAERQGWVIVVPQPPPLMVAADVEHMKKANIKTVAYIGYSDAWGDLVYDAIMKTAGPAGINVITNERYARADTSVTAQALKIVAARPDAVLTGGSGTPGALPHIGLAERGFRGPAYSTHAIINPDFIRVGGPSVEGVIAPTGPVVVAEQLPDSNPIKKVAMQFREVYQKALGEPTKDAFSAYAFDGYLIFADAAKRALAKAKPGTPEFRTALRDAMFATKELVGTHAVYNFKPGELYGVDERARVMVRLEKGQWKLMP
ncbi:MAG: ABC transporter substrate-binding protein [Proteobacteria bacterium]|nr:ABC transporter substrate-binding protein [Pseudomonadota bacterium]